MIKMKNLLIILIATIYVNNSHGSTILLEQTPIPDLLPTMYYIADESKTSCKGPYNGNTFDGSEVSEVLTPAGDLIAKVCTRFFKVLSMEGTGVLEDRGQGRQTINWAGRYRFKVMDKCVHGEGVNGLCLIPYHTIAADLEVYPVGTIIYIPRAAGIKLPNGEIHNGIFVVRDTGGAFRGVGAKRVDLFVGIEKDINNVFSRAGMNHHTNERAFKLNGNRRSAAIKYLKAKFPTLY